MRDDIPTTYHVTCLIVFCVPGGRYDDTHNTLKYANRAKNIKVRVTRNVQSVDHHISEYANLVAALRKEVW